MKYLETTEEIKKYLNSDEFNSKVLKSIEISKSMLINNIKYGNRLIFDFENRGKLIGYAPKINFMESEEK